MSPTSMSERMAPAALVRSNSRTLSSWAFAASRVSSSVGVKVPARRSVSECVSASTMRRMKSAKALKGFGIDLPKELLLASIAAVQGADAHAGTLGHRGDRCAGICYEHLSRGVQDPLVVARRLGPPAAQGCCRRLLHMISISHLERNDPFRYTGWNRTLRSAIRSPRREEPPHD